VWLLVGKPEAKEPTRISECNCIDNIKTNLGKTILGVVDWISLAHSLKC
jgi:hypothetical protein